MTPLIWSATQAIAQSTAYAIPTEAGLPTNSMLIGVVSVLIQPVASATTSPVTETPVSQTTTPAAGTVSLQISGSNAQQLISGDAIAAGDTIIVIPLTQADGVIQ